MKRVVSRRVKRGGPQGMNGTCSRISGVMGGITTVQSADVLDLSLTGALVEHRGKLPRGSSCFLQLGTNGELLTIRGRVVFNRVSRSRPDGPSFYQTGVEFIDLTPAAEGTLKLFSRSYGARYGQEGP